MGELPNSSLGCLGEIPDDVRQLSQVIHKWCLKIWCSLGLVMLGNTRVNPTKWCLRSCRTRDQTQGLYMQDPLSGPLSYFQALKVLILSLSANTKRWVGNWETLKQFRDSGVTPTETEPTRPDDSVSLLGPSIAG